MDLQHDFETLIGLLQKQPAENAFAAEALQLCLNEEVTYYTFDKSGPGTTKENLLGVYEIRARIQQDGHGKNLLLGYEVLLPDLRASGHAYVCLASVLGPSSAFIIFSDFGKHDLIGILKSTTRRNNDELKQTKSGVANTSTGHVFIKGRLC